jgi:hypothetical protein
MSHWLPWLLFGAVILVAPVLLRFFADDLPRSDDPPGEEREHQPGQAEMSLVALGFPGDHRSR